MIRREAMGIWLGILFFFAKPCCNLRSLLFQFEVLSLEKGRIEGKVTPL